MTKNISSISSDNPEILNSCWSLLYKISAAAGIVVEFLFLTSGISFIVSTLLPETVNERFLPIQNNWLIVLFKLNIHLSGANLKLLNLNLLDSIILILAGIMFLGLYTSFTPISRTWTIIALAQPFIGLMLFITTKMSGRLGIMSAMLIISLMMLQSNYFNKIAAILGILGSICLILGDAFSQATFSLINSTLIFIGYVLMLMWFLIIIQRLLWLGFQET